MSETQDKNKQNIPKLLYSRTLGISQCIYCPFFICNLLLNKVATNFEDEEYLNLTKDKKKKIDSKCFS